MDIKITKKRLSNFLTYECVKLIAIAVIVVIIWTLAYTTFAARLSEGQRFFLITYEGVFTKSQGNVNKFLSGAEDGGSVFSYDVREVNEESVSQVGEYSAHKLLDIKLQTYEADILVIGDGNVQYDPSDRDTLTEYQSLINSGKLISIEKLLSDAREYTVGNGFIIETDGGYTVNETKIESYFREERRPSSRNYRRTYVTEEDVKSGVKDEIKRIETVYLNYLKITKAIEKAKSQGKDFLNYKSTYKTRTEGVIISEKEPYGIDLGKLNEGCDKDVTDLWYVSGGGSTTADGIILTVFNFTSVQPDLQYESLGIIYYLIRNYSKYAD